MTGSAMGSAPAPMVDVWVDLGDSRPADAQPPTRRDEAERVRREQDRIAAELHRLGAIELARLRHTGNAIAVRIRADRLDAVRALPGVRHVRPTQGLHPHEMMDAGSAPRTQPR